MRMRLLFCPTVCLLVGCAGQGLAPVSGRVTLDGKPAANVHVSFQPMATGGNINPGGGSYAIVDEDGRFTLKTVDGDKRGAVVGKHRVEINIRPENAPSRRVVEKLGFREEAYHPRYMHIDGTWRDHLGYAMTSEEVAAEGGLLARWRRLRTTAN